MNVGELIARLNQFADDMPVIARGQRVGYDDVEEVEEVNVAWNSNAKEDGSKDAWYYGIHGRAELNSQQATVSAVYIGGR